MSSRAHIKVIGWQAPAGVLHGVDGLELFTRDCAHGTPLLTFPRPHDCVWRGTNRVKHNYMATTEMINRAERETQTFSAHDPHELVCLGPVGFVSRVDGRFVVPFSKLRVLQVRAGVHAGRVSEVVGLEQDALRERVVRECSEHLRTAAASGCE